MSAQNDAAFLRMFLLVLGALVAFTVIIMIAASQITGSADEERGADPRQRAALKERIAPIGAVNVATSGAAATAEAAAPAATEAAPAAAAAARSGAEVAQAACNACHIAGVAGAPKIGDADAWSQRLAAQGGVDGLTSSVINGKGAMPPRGGAQVSDEEIRAAVVHLLAESGVDAAADTAATEPEQEPATAAAPVEAMQQMAQDAADTAQSMAAAVMPGAESQPQPEAAGASAADLEKGQSVYKMACFVCHDTGAAGAPKLSDQAAWAPRLEQGMDTLYANSLNGKGAMPPKGGRPDIPDADIKAAVDYMVNEVQ